MAQQGNGDIAKWGYSTSTKLPQLPPKSPSFGIPGSHNDSNGNHNVFSGWSNLPSFVGGNNGNGNGSGNGFKHQRTPSMGFMTHGQHQNPSWMDELLENPGTENVRKGPHHRRSASDTLAFLDPPNGVSIIHEIAGAAEDEFDCRSAASKGSSHDFDRLDEDQLMSMFADIEPFHQRQQRQKKESQPPQAIIFGDNNNNNNRCSEGQPVSENPSTPSDHNSINEPSMEEKPRTLSGQFQGEPEVQSTDQRSQPVKTETAPSSSSMELDPNIDPKRVKRILANRQSAQRSRVRKLQYISELERSVNALQTEVSTLSPQVAYLDHQRVLLNVDNSALKQRMAALAQDKLFKDAHCEALQKEVQRLRQIYQEQQKQQMFQQQQQQNNLQKDTNTTACAATGSAQFDLQHFAKMEQNGNFMNHKGDISEASTNLVNGGGSRLSEDRDGKASENHSSCKAPSQIPKGMMTSNCLMGESNKCLEDRMVGGMSGDYIVQNP